MERESSEENEIEFGWILVLVNGKDQHMIPTGAKHEPTSKCWCEPEIEYHELSTNGEVWVHRAVH